MATAQTNKDVVQRGFDSLNDRDRDAFIDLHADDAVLHAFGEKFRGIDELVANQFGMFVAFPDFTYTPHAILAEGDTVAARWTVAGTHEGEFDGIEPTGEEVEFPAMGGCSGSRTSNSRKCGSKPTNSASCSNLGSSNRHQTDVINPRDWPHYYDHR